MERTTGKSTTSRKRPAAKAAEQFPTKVKAVEREDQKVAADTSRPIREYMAPIGLAGQVVKSGIVSSLKGVERVEGEIVALVRNTISDTMRASGAGDLVSTVRDVVKGAILASEDMGCGLLLASKSVAKGVVMGVSDVGGDTINAAAETGKAAVEGTASVGGDIALVAKRTVDGAVEAARETGGNVSAIAVATVNGAIVAAGGISKTAVNAVSDVLCNVASSVRQSAYAIRPASRQ